jgi:hypothetical protein
VVQETQHSRQHIPPCDPSTTYENCTESNDDFMERLAMVWLCPASIRGGYRKLQEVKNR